MTHPEDVKTQIGYLYPQNIRWFDQERLRPHVLGISGGINPETFQREYEVDPTDKIPVKFLARGFEYKFLGFIKVDRHIVATPIDSGRAAPYVLGTDRLGRDLWSRLMYPTRISMSIRLVGVAVSLILGVSLGESQGTLEGWPTQLYSGSSRSSDRPPHFHSGWALPRPFRATGAFSSSTSPSRSSSRYSPGRTPRE